MSTAKVLAAIDPDRQLGRINRRIYWALLVLLVGFDSWASSSPNLLAPVVLTIPWIVLYGLRLHDFGRSAWWGVAAMVVMIGLLGLGALAAPDAARALLANRSTARVPESQLMMFTALFAAMFLLFAGFTIWLGIKRGDPAANRYGTPIQAWGLRGDDIADLIRGKPWWFLLVLASMALLLGGGIAYGWWLILAGFWTD